MVLAKLVSSKSEASFKCMLPLYYEYFLKITYEFEDMTNLSLKSFTLMLGRSPKTHFALTSIPIHYGNVSNIEKIGKAF